MKIVIVGAGYAGAATAWWLARAGAGGRVTLLEGEPRTGRHASGRNAGLVMSLAEDEATCELTVRGASLLNERFGLTRRGSALLVAGEEEAGVLLERARQHHLPVEPVPTGELSRDLHALRGAACPVALRCSSDGTIDPAGTLDLYLGGARDGGVRIVTGAKVTAVIERSGRVTGVETTAGRFDADWIVNAAGAWAGRIASLAGLPEDGVRSFRRHLFLSGGDRRFAGGWPFVWDLSRDLYFRSDAGRLTLSPCDEEPHEPAPPEVDPAAEGILRAKLSRSIPALGSIAIDRTHACLRTFAADRRYIIGADPRLPGFFWVAGLGGSGATAGAAIGEMAADLLRGRTNRAFLHERFSPSRLTGGQEA